MLVAPLNWGLGHATRCIPIIKVLIKSDYIPVIASDGEALILLQQEFKYLTFYQLPSYKITYAKKGAFLPLKLLIQIPHIITTAFKEHRKVAEIVAKENIEGIISDNRFGVHHTKIPSVYITHQIQIKASVLSYFNSKIHHKIIEKFDDCWVPDVDSEQNFSGTLSNIKHLKIKAKYIGVLSRFKHRILPKEYQLLVLLSGPEPQRNLLEKKLIKELQNFKGKVLFVRGVFKTSTLKNTANIKFKNYLLSKDLETAILQSELVLARSGYTTIMDLAALKSKAFFIPTPGQTEQIYLAKRLCKLKLAPYVEQHNFTMKSLNVIDKYKGLEVEIAEIDSSMFKLFQGK